MAGSIVVAWIAGRTAGLLLSDGVANQLSIITVSRRHRDRFRALLSGRAERTKLTPMLESVVELVVIVALLAGALWLAVRAFERPQGVYVKSLVRGVLAIVGGFGLIVLLSPWMGSGAGMGVTFIYLAYIALVVAFAALACIAATAGHIWDAMRSPDRDR